MILSKSTGIEICPEFLFLPDAHPCLSLLPLLQTNPAPQWMGCSQVKMATTKDPSLPSLQPTHELNALVDKLINLREKNEPLAPSIEAIQYRTLKQKTLLETFHSEGPRIVAPLPSRTITWGDMIDEGLSHLDFKPYGDRKYSCNVQGIILEVTESERDELLGGNCEPHPSSMGSKSARERHARSQARQYVDSMINEISCSKYSLSMPRYDPRFSRMLISLEVSRN